MEDPILSLVAGANVHPSAVVSDAAVLASDVTVGPFSVIEGEVEIGRGSIVGPHCLIRGPAQIGPNNRFEGHCSFGTVSQDKKDRGGGRLQVGADNHFREFVSVHRSSSAASATAVGDGNLIMAYSHIAHDCIIGSNTVIANASQLGGHVQIGDQAVLGGGCCVLQNSCIGRLAFLGGGTILRQHLPPYVSCTIKFSGIKIIANKIGMRRAGMSLVQIATISEALRDLYRRSRTLREARRSIEAAVSRHECLAELAIFLAAHSRIIRPR